MEINDMSTAIYSEAKSEYTKQLVFNFQPVLLRFFLDRYNEAKETATVTSKTKSALSEFQDSLSQIPEWTLDKVQKETSLLLQTVHCDYIEDLITAVFIAHTKILSAIRLHAKPRRRIQITVPKPDHFMHRTLSECSRILWSNVYLLSDSVSSLDRQKNMNDVNRHLEEGILQAIRNLLPVKSILRESLQDDDDDTVHISMSEPSTEEKPELTPSVVEQMAETEVPVETPSTELPIESSLPVTSLPVTSLPLTSLPVTSLQVTSLPVVEIPTPTTLIVETEKTVGFTGVDSLYGNSGEAELRTMIEENNDEFQIIGDLEELNMNEFEDLNNTGKAFVPLAVEDYESL
jgi:hypothetical protein